MQEEHIDFSFTGRYFKLGEINNSTKKVWFVLHGYGQLAGYFIRKFRILESKDVCIIAPEGLSRFYLEDVNSRMQSGNNRVGSTWMTREDRLTDIHNYITFLTGIFQKEIGDKTDLEITILGFSQGAATASRWALENAIHFHRLILWAGIFPDDMDFKKGHEVLHSKRVDLVYGTQDPFINDDRLVHLKSLSDKLNITANVSTFHGAHEIHEATLLTLI